MGGFGTGPFGTMPFGLSSLEGVPFLVEQLGPDARISVQVAWGADLSAAYATWLWTDITTDVRMKTGIALRHGRNDEASVAQPAACTLVLDNSSGRYSLGGQSSNWPYVRANTPVRVRVDPADGSGFRALFIGYADTWQPSWDQSAKVAEVKLSASGVLRRLLQRDAPVLSSLRRRLTFETNVVGYWPLEEGRKSVEAASALPGHPALTITGAVDFGADTESFDNSARTAVVKNGSLSGQVPAYTSTGKWQVRVLMGFPDQLLTDQTILFRVYTDSTTVNRIDYIYGTVGSGAVSLKGYNSAGTQVLSTGYLDVDILNIASRVYVDAQQSGADVSFTWGSQDVHNYSGFGSFPTVVTGATVGRVTRVEVFPNADVNGVAVGHLVVQNDKTSTTTDATQLSAYDKEVSHIRFRRLCDENGIAHTEAGDGTVNNSVTDKMGVQKPKELLALLRDIEAVDGGIIYDGVFNEGLSLFMRRARENRVATMSIATSKLATPLQPIDDDSGRLNRAQVTREDGGDATFEDVTGPLGTANVGTYDASAAVNVATDAGVPHYASWLVHKGTVEGYRYPSIDLDFSATPELVTNWLSVVGPGRRIDLTGPGLVAAGHPSGDVRLEVQGFEQALTPYAWTVSINCAPYEPWRVIRLAADTADTSEFLGRLDAGVSTLAASAAAGATSLSVATSSGPLWTRSTDDFPLTIDVGGIAVTVTAISGTTSPQTFTVTGSTVTKALAASLPVTVRTPSVLGL